VTKKAQGETCHLSVCSCTACGCSTVGHGSSPQGSLLLPSPPPGVLPWRSEIFAFLCAVQRGSHKPIMCFGCERLPRIRHISQLATDEEENASAEGSTLHISGGREVHEQIGASSSPKGGTAPRCSVIFCGACHTWMHIDLAHRGIYRPPHKHHTAHVTAGHIAHVGVTAVHPPPRTLEWPSRRAVVRESRTRLHGKRIAKSQGGFGD
jgi:hypothetical protein